MRTIMLLVLVAFSGCCGKKSTPTPKVENLTVEQALAAPIGSQVRVKANVLEVKKPADKNAKPCVLVLGDNSKKIDAAFHGYQSMSGRQCGLAGVRAGDTVIADCKRDVFLKEPQLMECKKIF